MACLPSRVIPLRDGGRKPAGQSAQWSEPSMGELMSTISQIDANAPNAMRRTDIVASLNLLLWVEHSVFGPQYHLHCASHAPL